MSNITKLDDYRKKKRKSFLSKHQLRIERTISKFIDQNLDMDLLRLTYEKAYSGLYFQSESWDYVEFREILADALDKAIGYQLYRELMREIWFDHRLITREEIIEKCLSDFILSQCNYAVRT